MRLTHLSLTNFRNYARLELGLPDRLTVFQGANAQGKTNLLEAIHLLATGRSPRATAERELINWLALESTLPYARLTGEIGEGKDAQKLELVLELARNGGSAGPVVRKQVRINGVPKRALDLVGRLRVVLFLPEDVSLVAGAPSERRRYLDIALCQIAPSYCRALSEYQKVLAQRNALLRRLRDEGGDPGQLAFWDGQMAEHGSVLLSRRSQAVGDLDRIAAERHRDLTGGAERLRLAYLPSPDPARTAARPAARPRQAAATYRRHAARADRPVAVGSAAEHAQPRHRRGQLADRPAPRRPGLLGGSARPAGLRLARPAAHGGIGPQAGRGADDAGGDRRHAAPAAGRRDVGAGRHAAAGHARRAGRGRSGAGHDDRLGRFHAGAAGQARQWRVAQGTLERAGEVRANADTA